MKKAIVIGSSGAGKSVFSRKLAARTGLPLYYLDMIWHLPDKTTISRPEFDKRLKELLLLHEWIIDGNYTRTLPLRLRYCDTVFFFDLPVEVCLEGVEERLGKKRVDLPWVEDGWDPDFRQWIIDFPTQRAPLIRSLLKESGKKVILFHSRRQADAWLDSIQ